VCAEHKMYVGQGVGLYMYLTQEHGGGERFVLDICDVRKGQTNLNYLLDRRLGEPNRQS
jgi:hypothetical protein